VRCFFLCDEDDDDQGPRFAQERVILELPPFRSRMNLEIPKAEELLRAVP
jgi:hypothetical protein